MLEQEAIKRGLPIEEFKAEQRRLAKLVVAKDSVNFDAAELFAGVGIENLARQIVVGIVVIDDSFQLVEQKFSVGKPALPYIPGFRAYRELKLILDCYNKLQTKPDVVFIKAHGQLHPRKLGLASHLGLAIDNAVVGVATSLLDNCKVQDDNVYMFDASGKEKLIAKLVQTKPQSKAVIVSVGHKISLATAVKLVKKLTVSPYKLPMPLVMANKYARKVARELLNVKQN